MQRSCLQIRGGAIARMPTEPLFGTIKAAVTRHVVCRAKGGHADGGPVDRTASTGRGEIGHQGQEPVPGSLEERRRSGAGASAGPGSSRQIAPPSLEPIDVLDLLAAPPPPRTAAPSAVRHKAQAAPGQPGRQERRGTSEHQQQLPPARTYNAATTISKGGKGVDSSGGDSTERGFSIPYRGPPNLADTIVVCSGEGTANVRALALAAVRQLLPTQRKGRASSSNSSRSGQDAGAGSGRCLLICGRGAPDVAKLFRVLARLQQYFGAYDQGHLLMLRIRAGFTGASTASGAAELISSRPLGLGRYSIPLRGAHEQEEVEEEEEEEEGYNSGPGGGEGWDGDGDGDELDLGFAEDECFAIEVVRCPAAPLVAHARSVRAAGVKAVVVSPKAPTRRHAGRLMWQLAALCSAHLTAVTAGDRHAAVHAVACVTDSFASLGHDAKSSVRQNQPLAVLVHCQEEWMRPRAVRSHAGSTSGNGAQVAMDVRSLIRLRLVLARLDPQAGVLHLVEEGQQQQQQQQQQGRREGPAAAGQQARGGPKYTDTLPDQDSVASQHSSPSYNDVRGMTGMTGQALAVTPSNAPDPQGRAEERRARRQHRAEQRRAEQG